ncbi:hypothetical protein LTR78_001751 [Recurvomyces mirabilis]|uniref:Uncharacterized protein n=1 Tax=Recurvomyces mirabilis TaxID=574656 RepID=A0AAE1C578_9PEZI|nr:hypothetical protein LTR78_001751 [Recurvomyces mirabilis]KAK5150174.1 hypothetical protein LTS14_010303 [Recurvomyces mirabilis]
MASALGRVIEKLQAVDKETASAQNRVARLQRAKEQQVLQLATTQEQLLYAKTVMQRCEEKAAAVYHYYFVDPSVDRLSGATPNPPDDGESVRVSIPASKPSHLTSATAQSAGAESEDATTTVTHKREVGARGSDVCKTKAPPSIHRRFPIVVKFEGSWIEISCNYCGANSGINSGEFMKGVVGLGKHIKLHAAHERGVFPIAEILATCMKRQVSDRDALNMVRGRDPIDREIKNAVPPARVKRVCKDPKLPVEASMDDSVPNSTETRSFRKFFENLEKQDIGTAGERSTDSSMSRSSFGLPQKRRHESEPELSSFDMLCQGEISLPGPTRKRAAATTPLGGPLDYTCVNHDEDDEE